MARETHTSTASDEPVYEVDSLELFWDQHKAKVIGGAVVLVAIVVGIFGWLIYSNAQRHAAESAFGDAKTAAEYREVISQYASSPVAGNAALLLAKSLRDEKKYDEANQVLEKFIAAQPEHPFAPLARLAVAENLALAGKFDDSVKALQAIPQTAPKSFVAPVALLLEGEMESANNRPDDALQAYRQLQKTFPESLAARVSQGTLESMESMVPQTAAPAAAPAPAAPPQ